MDEENKNEDELFCPITLELFRDPVRAEDGHLYEREAITRWIQEHGTSPFTRQSLSIECLDPNPRIKELSAQRRNSTVSYKASTKSVTLPLACHTSLRSHSGMVVPLGQAARVHSDHSRTTCGGNSWTVTIFMAVATGGILLMAFFMILTKKGSSVEMNTPVSSDACLPSGSQSKLLLSLVNVTRFNYTYFSYLYTAISSNDLILFGFRQDPSYWCIDDISVIDTDSGDELIQNGGFESGSLMSFRYCSKQTDWSYNITRGNLNRHTGKYGFCIATAYSIAYLSQRLDTTEGQTYNISFCLKNFGESINIITMSMLD